MTQPQAFESPFGYRGAHVGAAILAIIAFIATVYSERRTSDALRVHTVDASPSGKKALRTAMSFKKLLLATDFSQASRAAFEAAVSMTIDSRGELVVVHVIQPYPYVAGIAEIPLAHDVVAREVANDLEQLVGEAARAGVASVSHRALFGSPWHQLEVLLVRDPSFDLVVVGTHGRTGIKHALLGSVAEKIVRHVPRPVLVVREHR